MTMKTNPQVTSEEKWQELDLLWYRYRERLEKRQMELMEATRQFDRELARGAKIEEEMRVLNNIDVYGSIDLSL